MPDLTWMVRAVCLTNPPRIAGTPIDFTTVSTPHPGSTSEVYEAAKRTCVSCSVRRECLQWANAAGVAGMAGGFTLTERNQLRATTKVA